MGIGGHLYNLICLGSQEASAHLSGILVSVSTSTVSQSVACILLDWILLGVFYVSCCCTFLCRLHYDYYSSGDCGVFWYVLCSFISYHGLLHDSASCKIGSACDMVLPPPLTPRCPGGVIGLACVPQQQPSSLMPL